jgi:two-component system sensor histidine kinase RpfC
MLIVDMNMPGISGIEVIKSLRFMDTSGELPIIMLTADATPEAREVSLNAGADRFLTKPIDARGLLECIASLSKKLHKSRISTPPVRQSSHHLHSNFEQSEWYDNMILHELEVLGNDPDFMRLLIRNFGDEGRKHILNLKKAVDDDYLDLRENLHALKGSSSELGAGKLVTACLEGEALKPYDLGTDKIHITCQHIEDVFTQTVAALSNAVTAEKQKYPGRQ